MESKTIYTTAGDGEGSASLVERENGKYVILRGLVAGEGVSIDIIDPDGHESTGDDHVIQISATGGGGSELSFQNTGTGEGFYNTIVEGTVLLRSLAFDDNFDVGGDTGQITVGLNTEQFAIKTNAAPSGPTATGVAGQYYADANYAYFCIATNTWIRVEADATWGT